MAALALAPAPVSPATLRLHYSIVTFETVRQLDRDHDQPRELEELVLDALAAMNVELAANGFTTDTEGHHVARSFVARQLAGRA